MRRETGGSTAPENVNAQAGAADIVVALDEPPRHPPPMRDEHLIPGGRCVLDAGPARGNAQIAPEEVAAIEAAAPDLLSGARTEKDVT